MATDFDTARSQYDNYRFCYDNGHANWIKTAKTCFDFWSGKQWDAEIKAKLAAAGRPALTFNVVESLIRAMKGAQRALRNDVRFAPVESASAEGAKIQDVCWLDVQNQNDLDSLETEVYEKGLIMGRGYYDLRVSYDNSLKGDIKIRSPRSQDVILDPSVDTYDPAQDWPQVFTRRWVNFNDLTNMFGKEKSADIGLRDMPGWSDYEDLFMAQQMGRMPYYTSFAAPDSKMLRGYLLLNRQYIMVKQKDVFVDMQTGDTSEIPETWERDRVSRVLELTPGLGTMKRKVKTVRWDVTCEGTTLHSADSPYSNFTIVPFFPTFLDGHTMGAVESLLDPQQLFNKMTSQELHIINTTANSGYKIKKGALKNMTIAQAENIGAKSGVIFELDDVANMEKITPNQTPQGHDRLSFKADQIMRSLAGVPNSTRGFARDDASGDKVMEDQAAQEVNSAGWLANLHRSKRLLALRNQDCVRTHYTETRVINLNRGSALNPEYDQVTINQPTPEGTMLNDVTMGRYSTVLVPSPSRTSMSEADFKLLLVLREKLGIAIPDSMLIELSPASNKSQIIAALQGNDSNDRQRAAEDAAAQQAQIDQQKDLATAKKEEAAAMLNQARAQKATVESQIDPDAAYREVETQRIAADQAQHDDKIGLERRKVSDLKDFHDKTIAVNLEKIDADKAKAKAAANKPAARRTTKAK